MLKILHMIWTNACQHIPYMYFFQFIVNTIARRYLMIKVTLIIIWVEKFVTIFNIFLKQIHLHEFPWNFPRAFWLSSPLTNTSTTTLTVTMISEVLLFVTHYFTNQITCVEAVYHEKIVCITGAMTKGDYLKVKLFW